MGVASLWYIREKILTEHLVGVYIVLIVSQLVGVSGLIDMEQCHIKKMFAAIQTVD
jgi:hypothetical protein